MSEQLLMMLSDRLNAPSYPLNIGLDIHSSIPGTEWRA